jgi:hypothetical protein
MLLILNTRMFYLSFCTSFSTEDEFLVTENGYGTHEGPVSNVIDVETGDIVMSCYSEYQSSRTSRQNGTQEPLLPLATEDTDAGVKESREVLHRHQGGNSYKRMVDGRMVPFR